MLVLGGGGGHNWSVQLCLWHDGLRGPSSVLVHCKHLSTRVLPLSLPCLGHCCMSGLWESGKSLQGLPTLHATAGAFAVSK